MDLLPPRGPEQAEELARAGALVLDLLPSPAETPSDSEVAGTIRTAALLGGERALSVIRRFRGETRPAAVQELDDAWGRFDARTYSDAVLADATLGAGVLTVRTPEQLACLEDLDQYERLRLFGIRTIPAEVASRRGLRDLYVLDSPDLTDIEPLAALRGLTHLSLNDCRGMSDLGPLSDLALKSLFTIGTPRVTLGILDRLPGLTALGLGGTGGLPSVGEFPGLPALTGLWLYEGTEDMSLDGLERWPDLDILSVTGSRQSHELRTVRRPPDLTRLQMIHHHDLDPAELLRFPRLATLWLADCRLTAGTGAWRELTGLTSLTFSACHTVDLTPLAGLPELTVHVYRGTEVLGADPFPPERLLLKA
ncbi:hypothetical protein ACIQZO_02990 [Streptomyces sp. NPDC097617]|uniref:hypothetical protein n=1 Tax=Streptomyces sp. NPDC097617 TaxID=3366091 RepID=UPI003803521B